MSRSLWLLLVIAGACVRVRQMPITATQVAQAKDRGALVAYLRQRDASPRVCDLGSDGPHVATVDGGVTDELLSGLRENRLSTALWEDCIGRLLHSADRESARSLFDAVAHAYKETLGDGRVERDTLAQQRLSAMQRLLLGRRGVVAPRAKVMSDLLAWLSDAKTQRRFGSVRLRFAKELIADVELERGTRGGRPVDIATLDELFDARDESSLRQYALRLPDEELRTEAKRRIIRLHIQASRYPEVRENGAAIETVLMRDGVNPADTRQHRPVRAWIDSSGLAARGVLVRQDLQHQTSALLGYADDASTGGVSVLPQIQLRGVLQLRLDEIDFPVTLCAPPAELDPTPCVTASEVDVRSRVAHIDPDGTLRFVDELTPRDAAALAESSRRLQLPIVVAGRSLAVLDWPLRFALPNDLVFGPGRSGDGPALRVKINVLETGRLLYDVAGGDRPYRAIVERTDAARFQVISRGADGQAGFDGSSGRDGLFGSSGSPPAAVSPVPSSQ